MMANIEIITGALHMSTKMMQGCFLLVVMVILIVIYHTHQCAWVFVCKMFMMMVVMIVMVILRLDCYWMCMVVYVMIVMMMMMNVFYMPMNWNYEMMMVMEYVCFRIKWIEYFRSVVNRKWRFWTRYKWFSYIVIQRVMFAVKPVCTCVG